MKRESRKFHPLWIALAAAALALVVTFASLTGIAAGAAGESGALPVDVSGSAQLMAQGGDTFAAAEEGGTVSGYSLQTGALLWTYEKPVAAKINDLQVRGGHVFAAYEDRTICRLSAATGKPEGVLTTNYVPQSMTFSDGESDLFAVYGTVGARREVYLLSDTFGGDAENPASWRDYPKLDGGEYASSAGGVELGVQGIFISAQGEAYIATDTYSVRKFTASGMADGYAEYQIGAEKLAAFCAVEDGFAGVDLKGNFYRFDENFSTLSEKKIGADFTYVKRAGKTFYALSERNIVGADAERGKLFSLSLKSETLTLAAEESFALSNANGVRCYPVSQAANIEAYGSKLPVFVTILIVSCLFLCYAGASVYAPVRRRVNRAFAAFGRTIVKHRFAYLGLIPTFALLAVFYYWPIVRGFALSFFNYNGVTSKFVGFQNFADVLHNTMFWDSAVVMLVLLVTDILKAIIPPLFFAEFILAVRNKTFSFAVRVLLFIPGILPGVAGTLVWVNGIFGSDGYGLMNSICSLFVPGFMQTWIGPYLETRSLVSLIMFAFPWVGSYLIFYGGVMGIPKSLFEAAELDGCGWWRRMFTIDLPLIFAQLKYIFITSFIASVQDYGRLFITDQSTGHGIKVPALIIYEYIYKGGSEPNYGLSSAMSMYLFAFLLVATIINFRKQTDKEAA